MVMVFACMWQESKISLYFDLDAIQTLEWSWVKHVKLHSGAHITMFENFLFSIHCIHWQT